MYSNMVQMSSHPRSNAANILPQDMANTISYYPTDTNTTPAVEYHAITISPRVKSTGTWNQENCYDPRPKTHEFSPVAVPAPVLPSPRNNKKFGFDLDDCYHTMRNQEWSYTFYRGPSLYLPNRRVVVDWTCEAGKELGLQKSTAHSATVFLDIIFMDKSTLPSSERMQMLSLCCLFIASKYEEFEDHIPTLHEIWEVGNRSVSRKKFLEMEIDVLRMLNWKLTVLTPIHFINFFLEREIFFENDHICGQSLNDQAKDYYRKYAIFFAELCLQEYSFQQYLSSIVAASILYVSRKALNMSPLWCEELALLTGYDFDAIEGCTYHIWGYYSQCFPSMTCTGKHGSPSSVADARSYSYSTAL